MTELSERADKDGSQAVSRRSPGHAPPHWATTTDHKEIGLLHMVTATIRLARPVTCG